MSDGNIVPIGYSDGDIDTNRSANPTLVGIIEERYSRRQTMFGGAAALTTAATARFEAGDAIFAAQALQLGHGDEMVAIGGVLIDQLAEDCRRGAEAIGLVVREQDGKRSRADD